MPLPFLLKSQSHQRSCHRNHCLPAEASPPNATRRSLSPTCAGSKMPPPRGRPPRVPSHRWLTLPPLRSSCGTSPGRLLRLDPWMESYFSVLRVCVRRQAPARWRGPSLCGQRPGTRGRLTTRLLGSTDILLVSPQCLAVNSSLGNTPRTPFFHPRNTSLLSLRFPSKVSVAVAQVP